MTRKHLILLVMAFCGGFSVFVGWLAAGCASALIIGLFEVDVQRVCMTIVLLLCSLITWTALWVLLDEYRAT